MFNLAETKKAALALMALLFAAVTAVHGTHFAIATPVSRLDLLHALVSRSTAAIDAYDTNTPDKAIWGGHYYSDKAPGTSVLALPGFALAAVGLKVLGVPLDSPRGWLVSSWAACAGSVAILAALGGGALLCWLRRRVPARAALVTTLALFLGAAPLPYATMLFSHSMVVGLIAIAQWAMEEQTHLRQKRTEVGGQRTADRASAECGVRQWLKANQWDLVAGHCCGWALASEYTAGLVVVGLAIWGSSEKFES